MLELNAIFADRMVLQAGKPVRIFGRADSPVTVSLERDTVTVDADGFFTAELPARRYGGPYTLTVQTAAERVELHDVLIGEVLLCSGQSNMQFTMKEEVTPPAAYRADDRLRLFTQTRPEANQPLGSGDGWLTAQSETIDDWTALGYLTGCALRDAGVPAVGIVHASQGASVIQSWMDTPYLADPLFDIPTEQLFGDHTYWEYNWNGPTFLYREMLQPLLPYSFGCVVWYQGESNASPAESRVYDRMMAAMVENWREADRDAALPFIMVQIADTRTDEGWLEIQAAQQRAAAAVPGLTMVRSADVCEKEMIHPVTKGPLAKRIAAAVPLAE